MKLDIILNNASNMLYVDDFHLSPISNNIPYTYYSNDNLLNYSHKDNVKKYFQSIEGYFYNEGLDTNFTHNWPIVTKSNKMPNIYSSIYDMGCKRTNFYKLYKKQFEFLCPLWLEHVDGDIVFKFTIKTKGSNEQVATKTLTLNNNDYDKHNKFVKYIKNHFDECGINSGNDNLLNIQFDNNTAFITGLNAKTGIIETKNVNAIINQLTSRERPLMEFDNVIINAFANNNIICNQLYNFNFCFNITDLVSSTIASMLYGTDLIISVNTIINGKELPIKDFYTNYEHIDRNMYYTDKSTNLFNNLNVLDYLNDNAYIDFKNKNKFCQKICHWSLCENNDYIFNLYKGFAGYCVQEKSIIENEYQYGNSPNTNARTHSFMLNNAGWVNTIEIDNYNDVLELINGNVEVYSKYATKISEDRFIHNIKYDIDDLKYNNKSIKDNPVYLINVLTDSTIMGVISGDASIKNKYNIINTDFVENNIYLLVNDNIIMLVSNSYDGLTFKNVFDCLGSLYGITDYHNKKIINAISFLYEFMNSKVDPKIISISGSLNWMYVNGPSIDVKEIEYFKNDNFNTCIERYDGKIKPTFVDDTGTIYYKDFIIDDAHDLKLKKSLYAKYMCTGYDPLYSSINYYSIKKTNTDNQTIPIVKTSNSIDAIDMINDIEYSWFNNSSTMYISDELNFTYINRKINGEYESLDSIVYKLLKSYYKTNDDKIKYIMSKYDVKNTWEYLSDDNIDDYMYNIKLTMK
jgi:hypothetical protein